MHELVSMAIKSWQSAEREFLDSITIDIKPKQKACRESHDVQFWWV